MLNNAHKSELHAIWHRRVEGQIRDVIYSHPEWFNFIDSNHKKYAINSFAKRIVGEIIAGAKMADNEAGCFKDAIVDNKVASVDRVEVTTGHVIVTCVSGEGVV